MENNEKEAIEHIKFQLKTYELVIKANPENIESLMIEFNKQYCRILNKYDKRVYIFKNNCIREKQKRMNC